MASHCICSLWRPYCTQHYIFKVHPCCIVCQKFIPLEGWVTLYCIYKVHFAGKVFFCIMSFYSSQLCLFSSPILTKTILVFSVMFQVRKWFGSIVKPKSESETFTLSSKFGAYSKPSEVKGLVIYSNVSPLVTPNFLSLSYHELPFLEGLGKCCSFCFFCFSWWPG